MKRIAHALLTALLITSSMSGVANAQVRDGRGQQTQMDRGRDANTRADRNWNARSHNGFYVNGRFQYGEPTAAQRNRADFRAGFQNWRRGDRLPTSYRSHYRQVDYRRERLRAPARGQQYVRTDRGDILLVGIATGVILSIIASR